MASAASSPITGQCACGAVRFSSNALSTRITRCHCHICRRISGSDYMVFGGFSRLDLQWTSDGKTTSTPPYDIPNVKHLSLLSFTHRGSCEKCSSALFMYYDFDPDEVSIALSILDRESAARIAHLPQSDIFVADKAPWHHLPEGTKQYQSFPTKFQKEFDRRAKNEPSR